MITDSDEDVVETLPFCRVVATQIIRQLRGTSRSILVLADDSELYVVKLAGNPGGPNVLANEVLGQLLCDALDLPAAQGAFVYVSDYLLSGRDTVDCGGGQPKSFARGGIHYGSRYVGRRDGQFSLFDILPRTYIRRILNRSEFVGMLILDIWANHQDHRQALFSVSAADRAVSATFIDHGDMFGGPHNVFDDSRCKAFSRDSGVYKQLYDTDMIERWKDRIYETMPAVLLKSFEEIPKSWYDDNHKYVRMILASRLEDLDRLVEPFLSVLRDLD